jgi:cytochrome d ubiquinol oxidase subunit I
VLPTFLGTSSLTVGQLWTTIIGFTLLYGGLAVIEVRLMLATIRKGPVEPHDEARADAATGGYAPLPAE